MSTNPPAFRCRAILFDLDGTLIDSVAAVDRAWTRWALRHNLDPAEVVPKIHGRRAVESIRLFAPGPDIDIELERTWLETAEAGDTEGIAPILGALEFIASIPPARWGIVTSGASPVAIARMKAGGVATQFVVYGEDVERGKPSPDPYLLGARRLGFEPADCLVFEDTAAGILAGKSAGMQVIAVAGGADQIDIAEPNAIIQDYRALQIDQQNGWLLVKFAATSKEMIINQL